MASNVEKVPLVRPKKRRMEKQSKESKDLPSTSTATRILQPKERPPLPPSDELAAGSSNEVGWRGEQREGDEQEQYVASHRGGENGLEIPSDDSAFDRVQPDTLKRLKRSCRDFQSEISKMCLYINQQAYANKEVWSNQPPYTVLCQNDVSKLTSEAMQSLAVFVKKIETFDVIFASYAIPCNKAVCGAPHPFDGHTHKRVVNAFERWRLLFNENYKHLLNAHEFEIVLADLQKKERSLEAKQRYESKMAQQVSQETKVAVNGKSAAGGKMVALETKDGVKMMNYPEYHNKVLALMGREKTWGKKFANYDMSQYHALKKI